MPARLGHGEPKQRNSILMLGFDVFMIDYRGYGKSGGKIESSEISCFQICRKPMTEIKKRYDENSIIVLGYSIGTGPALYLASKNDPKMLILQAPFYNLTDMMKRYFPIFPSFLLKYKMENDRHLKEAKMPVIIFHGNEDEVIYYGSSVKLSQHFKEGDRLITLEGQSHNGMTYNADYQREMKNILIPDMHTTMNSLDWDGTYTGILPCADCEGIETSLSIRNNMTYRLERRYIGKSDEIFRTEGKFKWSIDGRIIVLENETHGRYQVGENALFQLDIEGRRITGELADKYILRQDK
jgi:esterase/lipase